MGDNERLCAIGPCLGLKRYPPRAGLASVTARSAGQCLRLNQCTELLELLVKSSAYRAFSRIKMVISNYPGNQNKL